MAADSWKRAGVRRHTGNRERVAVLRATFHMPKFQRENFHSFTEKRTVFGKI